MIANSDQIVDFDIQLFVSDCLDRDLDVNTHLRIATKIPNGHTQKQIMLVLFLGGRENPISEDATVGIYMFRRGADFVDAAIDMLVANERVNGEFYTCPVYNYMIKKGAKIGIYEIAPEQMHGLGTPDDLIEYLSFFGLPNSKDMPK